jgi:phosphoglycerol transferase MdoB-like AlkP superfamily enzyme
MGIKPLTGRWRFSLPVPHANLCILPLLEDSMQDSSTPSASKQKCGAPSTLCSSAPCSYLKPFLILGPVAVPAFLIASGLLICLLFRAALTLTYLSRFSDTPEVWRIFTLGLRMDLILLCYSMILPTLLLLLLSKAAIQRIRKPLCLLLTVFMAFLVYMEMATFPFVAEFDLRPDQKFIEYLPHVREVTTMVIRTYTLELSIAVIVLLVCVRFFGRATGTLLREYNPLSWKLRLLLFPLIIGLLVLGGRSSIGHRPANLSTAAFSNNHLANEFALNSTYSLFYAGYRMLRHAKNPSLDYGKMPREEVLRRVALRSGLPEASALQEIPFLLTQISPLAPTRPPNVVIFLQESMGAVDVGCLKGPDITPNLCRLKEEGLWLSNLYATGTRTVRGIEATISGFLPSSAVGVLKLGLAKKNFFTAASLFKKHGYETQFHYGGMSNFDEMRSFFLGNGFEKIFDEPTFENPAFHGTWGVSDEDLVRNANRIFAAKGDEPFFALMLSTSNHIPYEFPDGRIELYEQPKQTHFNAIKYADYAIGLFFELAKKERYFENTIFLVVADHNSHVRGNEHVPVSKFHIPGLLIGPQVPRTALASIASQIDLLPTILHFTGLTTEHPLVGRNLMQIPEGDPGRAFMQYASNNAYRVGDSIVINRPFLPPEQFHYQNEKLVPMPLDPELAKDALAYAHLPWILYSEQRYRLPGG